MNNYFAVYKPFNVLSQFTSQDEKKCLKDFFEVPDDVYPVGRLDYDSEGLLILTNDKKLNSLLLEPVHAHEREYLVQVEGEITNAAITALAEGIEISIDGKLHVTKKCRTFKMKQPPVLPARNPPIRIRKNIPESWLRLIITEGKNRQVRKMTAKAGYPTLRLIRYRIEKVTIEGLQPGEMKMFSQREMYNLLNIKKEQHVEINDRVWKGRTNNK
ncbi:pseudouridine synthase [soil metagenome]